MDRTEFASRIGIQETTLERLSFRAHRCYVSYYKPKKDGAGRPIDAPNVELKGVQSFVLREILEKVTTHDAVHGFRKGRGVRTNAKKHPRNQYFLCVDIKSFFPSVTFEQVKEVFEKIVQNTFLSEMLTRICTLNRRLPQGGVTSPYLSNLVFFTTDERITEYCRSRRIAYTRYADDLTFSASDKSRLVELLVELEKILKGEGFELNPKKDEIHVWFAEDFDHWHNSELKKSVNWPQKEKESTSRAVPTCKRQTSAREYRTFNRNAVVSEGY